MTKEEIAALPRVEYDAIKDEFQVRGIDLSDILGAHGHFRRWEGAKGLPTAADVAESQRQMQMYRDDPKGEAACPAYVNFWHWLTEVYETYRWTEESSRRHKLVPMSMEIYAPVMETSEEDIAAGRQRLEQRMGIPISDEMWAPLASEARQGAIRQAKCREIAAEIIERHGAESSMGRIVLMHMQVSR